MVFHMEVHDFVDFDILVAHVGVPMMLEELVVDSNNHWQLLETKLYIDVHIEQPALPFVVDWY